MLKLKLSVAVSVGLVLVTTFASLAPAETANAFSQNICNSKNSKHDLALQFDDQPDDNVTAIKPGKCVNIVDSNYTVYITGQSFRVAYGTAGYQGCQNKTPGMISPKKSEPKIYIKDYYKDDCKN